MLLAISATMMAEDRKEATITKMQNNPDKDSHITGHVINSSTGEHLAYIDIVIEGTTIGTMTDATGHYYLKNIPIGTLTIRASALGYTSQTKTVNVVKNSTTEIHFEVAEDLVMLEGSVVSSSLTSTNRKETSNLVNVVTPKLFATTSSASLADALNFQPGLRVENNCQNCGTQQVRINGLEGNYTQLLLDNRAISSALSGVYGLEQLPLNMIERVEIIRGGGSALFGANAVAGTINIITKEAFTNSFQASNNTTVIGKGGIDNLSSINGTMVSDDNKVGAAIFASVRERSAYDVNGDGFSEIPTIKSKSIGTRAYFRTSDNTKLTAEYNTIYEYRRGGDNINLPPHEAEIAEELDHNINTANVKYDIYLAESKHWLQAYTSFQHINRDSYYGTGKDLNAYGQTTDFTSVSGLQYVWRMDNCLFMPANFTAGTEYSYSNLEDNTPGYNRYVNQTVKQSSVFLQNEWKNEKLTFLVGGRMDYHSILAKPILSPRVNLRYTPVSWLALRGGFASGFRAPQVFDEDLHIEALGGSVVMIENAEDLKEERSNSINFSADFNKSWTGGAVTFLVEGFYTELSDVFILSDDRKDADGNLIKVRSNGSGAYVTGINLESRIVPTRDIEFQLGFTYQQSKYKEAEKWTETLAAQDRMFRTPDMYGFITANYSPIENLDFSFTANYTGSMLVQHTIVDNSGNETFEEVDTPSFVDMSAKIGYDLPLKGVSSLRLELGVKNILNSYQDDLDIGPNRDAGYVYGPSLPRSVYFALKFSF